MIAHALRGDDLLDQVNQCALVEPETLWQYLTERNRAGLPLPEAAVLGEELVRDGLLTPFQLDHVLAGAGRSLVVGRYRLLDQLGGSTSTVFLAQRRPDGPPVAIKLQPVLGSTPAEVARFRAECEALARLDHPGVPAIKETGEDEGRLFVVMEYVESKTLAQLVAEQGALAPVPAARLIHAAAGVLTHVHDEGMVHGDLHAEHLMQDEHGGVRLIDFGRVRFLDEPPAIRADPRDDVYCLGAVLFLLLAGRPPSHQGVVVRGETVTRPERLLMIRPDLPRPLLNVVERMTAEDAGRRYQHMSEVVRALGTWLAEVAPPPMRELKRSSAQGAMTRPSAQGVLLTAPEALDLLMPPEPPPAQPKAETSWVPMVLATVAVVALLAALGMWALG